MKKTFLIFAIFFLTIINSNAALYKGQRVYSKVCMACHTDREGFVSTKTQDEWAGYMNNKGSRLSVVHINSGKFKKEEKYIKYKKYFEGKRFKKKSKHLKEFLIEYAKDSGNVPACN
jgi:cytochrome c1